MCQWCAQRMIVEAGEPPVTQLCSQRQAAVDLSARVNNIFDVYSKCGLMGEKFILDSIKSLLLAKNLDINITMKQFYDINNIELHFYSTKLNKKKVTRDFFCWA